MSKVGGWQLVLLLNLLLIAGPSDRWATAHSLGVLAAAVDYLGDAAAISVSLFAVRLPTVGERISGSPNPTHIAALVNAGWLLALNGGVVVVAIRRLASGAGHAAGHCHRQRRTR